MMRGMAPLSKTVHGTLVSTRGITVPSTPKDQTGKFLNQRSKERQRAEPTLLPPPTIPKQRQQPQTAQSTSQPISQVSPKEREPRQAIWTPTKDSPTREHQPDQQGQAEDMHLAEEEEDQEAEANHLPSSILIEQECQRVQGTQQRYSSAAAALLIPPSTSRVFTTVVYQSSRKPMS